MLGRKTTAMAPRKGSSGTLFEDFDRIFDEFRSGLENAFWTPMAPLPPWGMDGVRPAAVDLKDAGKEFVLAAELPGVAKDDLDINVTEDGVEIRAKAGKEEERKDGGYYVHERTYGEWYRRLPFPAEVLPDDAEADLKYGVLTLPVPKK